MDDKKFYPPFLLFSLGLILSLKYVSGFNNGSVRCIERERQALLKFKHGLVDDFGVLSSWGNTECCKWWGVKCNNRTGHVIVLDLRGDSSSWPDGRILRGEVSLSVLIELQHLRSVDLSNNNFTGSQIGEAIGSFHRLECLNLSNSHFGGVVPDQLGNLSNLQSLDLSWNYDLTTNDLVWLSQLRLLRQLDLSSIKLDMITNWMHVMFNLSVLEELHLSDCQLGGHATPFLPLLLNSSSKSLSILDLSFNKLTSSSTYYWLFNISPEWMPPFQLDVINLSNCSLGPYFPQWLRTQTNLSWLDLSLNGISETIPNWFWNFSLKLGNLNLSHNQISGSLPELSPKFDGLSVIDLSCNNFSGPILSVPQNVSVLNLHKNMFMGPISFVCITSGRNFISIDLSDNLFSGDLPNCWMNMTKLMVLNLADNRFSGPIPESFGFLREVRTLHLGNNHFIGEIPSSIKNCGQLKLVCFGGNNLTGNVPSWMGMFLTSLVFLSLRSNYFYGSIPQNICHLSYIRVLDFSHNNISGEIPQCFNNFTYLVQNISPSNNIASTVYVHGIDFGAFVAQSYYMDNMWFQWKRYDSYYSNILGLLKAIDLSDNKLVGQIPKEIASLRGLISLNLSVNHLTGNIVSHIDQMEMLESLDLSRNQLSGEIPAGLARLNFLSLLDLSYNKLSGRIPSSTQLQGFDPSAFIGNSGLCGLPLDKCPGDDDDPRPTNHGKDDNVEDTDGFIGKEFYMGMGLGFLVGLWGVVVVLLKDSWRNAYFRFLKHAN